MKIRRAVRNFLGAAFVAASLLGTTPTGAQERRAAPRVEQERRVRVEVAEPARGGCPRPVAVTLKASPGNVVNSDFAPTYLAMPRAPLGGTQPNQGFLQSFQWARDGRCCEITKAVLTVEMRAIQSGQSKESSDAGNDHIHLMHGGSVVQPYSEPVYGSWPFAAGQTAVKTWDLQGAALSYLNTHGTVSFFVQDDTSVVSATLQIYGCCLSEQRRGAVEDARPERLVEAVRP